MTGAGAAATRGATGEAILLTIGAGADTRGAGAATVLMTGAGADTRGATGEAMVLMTGDTAGTIGATGATTGAAWATGSRKKHFKFSLAFYLYKGKGKALLTNKSIHVEVLRESLQSAADQTTGSGDKVAKGSSQGS